MNEYLPETEAHKTRTGKGTHVSLHKDKMTSTCTEKDIFSLPTRQSLKKQKTFVNSNQSHSAVTQLFGNWKNHDAEDL